MENYNCPVCGTELDKSDIPIILPEKEGVEIQCTSCEVDFWLVRDEDGGIATKTSI
jgi:DNA-directed RNA polymerase subunit RPC12/RpoP